MAAPDNTTKKDRPISYLSDNVIGLIFSEAQTLDCYGKPRSVFFYTMETTSGAKVTDWVLVEFAPTLRETIRQVGFVQDKSWQTTPPTTRFVRETP